jgi:hypothetical protein
MKNRLYQFKNVAYTFAGKWNFVVSLENGTTFHYRTTLPGGRETADKVARQVAGAVARSGKLDNLARVTIDKILASVEA